jgi:hypothetical protein
MLHQGQKVLLHKQAGYTTATCSLLSKLKALQKKRRPYTQESFSAAKPHLKKDKIST